MGLEMEGKGSKTRNGRFIFRSGMKVTEKIYSAGEKRIERRRGGGSGREVRRREHRPWVRSRQKEMTQVKERRRVYTHLEGALYEFLNE